MYIDEGSRPGREERMARGGGSVQQQKYLPRKKEKKKSNVRNIASYDKKTKTNRQRAVGRVERARLPREAGWRTHLSRGGGGGLRKIPSHRHAAFTPKTALSVIIDVLLLFHVLRDSGCRGFQVIGGGGAGGGSIGAHAASEVRHSAVTVAVRGARSPAAAR